MGSNVNRAFFETYMKAQEGGNPLARYIKTINGRVFVKVIDPFSGTPTDIELRGNPATAPKEDIVVTIWTQFEHEFFRRMNKILLDRGIVAPFTEEIVEQISVNEISDSELREVLNKKYFALKNLLESFTSPEPVKRLLNIAKEMNRPVGTITKIEERLAELQVK